VAYLTSATNLPEGDLQTLIQMSGLRRINILAWRDLADPEAGGSELHAHQVAGEWSEAGLDVTFRTSYASGHRTIGRRAGYQVIRRAGRYLIFPRAVAGELAGFHGKRDALVEIWNGVPFFSPLWASGPKMVFLHHPHQLLWPIVLSPNLARVGSFLERRIAPPCYRSIPIVTLSESSKKSLTQDLGLPPQHIYVVEPGIDSGFSPGDSRSEQPLVLAVGRLMPSKRFDTLIEMMLEVRKDVPRACVEIIGDGYARDDIEKLVQKHSAESWFKLCGRVNDRELLAAYRRAWVIASPSITEGWGMVLTEAAACGIPAVATDIPGHRDAVEDGVTGILVNNDGHFVDNLVDLLSDKNRRESLGKAAHQRSSRYNWNRTATEAFRVLASTVHHDR